MALPQSVQGPSEIPTCDRQGQHSSLAVVGGWGRSSETLEALVSLRNAATIREYRLRRQLTGVIKKIRVERAKIEAWNEAISATENLRKDSAPNAKLRGAQSPEASGEAFAP